MGGIPPVSMIVPIRNVISCIIGLMTSISAAMLAFRSKVIVQDHTAALCASSWKAQLPVAAPGDPSATNQIGPLLRKRTNGVRSGKVSTGWFQDPNRP